jgi:hypothetical protein
VRLYANICIGGLRKTKENLSRDSGSSDRDFNPGPPKYKVGVLPTVLWSSVEEDGEEEDDKERKGN